MAERTGGSLGLPFHPPKSVSDVRRAALSMETVAEGYCRLEHLRSVRGDGIVPLEFRQEGKMDLPTYLRNPEKGVEGP